MTDQEYMQLALQMASAVEGRTWPNPMVGAVVVQGGQIVGMGAHLKAGEPHAEVHALNMAGASARGATLYVTLEPCSHYGKTPPCADRVIAAGVARVVIAMLDPNPLVAGSGVKRIRQAGIEVEVGILAAEASKLNEVWLTNIQHQRPFIWMKAAMTLDGKIASSNGDSKWITRSEARSDVHRVRNVANAILVGIGTVIADDPKLTTRLPEAGRNPIRVVLDRDLRVPETAQVLNDEAPTIIACGTNADLEKISRLQKRGIEIWQMEQSEPYNKLQPLLFRLYNRGVSLLLVEGGGKIHGSFLHQQLVDKVSMYIAPKLIGGTGPTPIMGQGVANMMDAVHLREVTVKQIGPDFVITGYPVWKGSDE